MKLSQLIELLQDEYKQHGDVVVEVRNESGDFEEVTGVLPRANGNSTAVIIKIE